MPILKQLVSGTSQSKRRSRMDLTREMISAPLGDFRHTMHVGRSGDAFGDTSFLSSRSGEPPPPSSPRQDSSSFPRSPRPGLLSRTFRSSRRSQSVNRVDRGDTPAPSGGSSPTYVKNAMSLPFLNDETRGDGPGWGSLTSSPLRQPANGAPATAEEAHILELHERSFGELTALPESARCYGGGMKRTESVMSFHVDLGPSMLGDILDVMQKEDDDLGYEEGKSSEGRASPPLSTHGDDDDDEEEEEEDEKEEEQQGAGRSPAAEGQQASTHPGPRPKHLQLLLDTSSLSSAGSSALEEKPGSQGLCSYAGDTDSATFSAPPEDGECNFSSFMEDEDDEIRV